MSLMMNDSLPRFAPQDIKLGKRSREYCPISMEHTPGCFNLPEMTRIPAAPSHNRCGLSRNCFKSLADLTAVEHSCEKHLMSTFLPQDQKQNDAWGWFVSEDY